MEPQSIDERVRELILDVDSLCGRYKLVFNILYPTYGEPLVIPLENTRDRATIVAGIMKNLLDKYGIEFSMCYDVVSASSGELCWGYGYPIFTLIKVTWNKDLSRFEEMVSNG